MCAHNPLVWPTVVVGPGSTPDLTSKPRDPAPPETHRPQGCAAATTADPHPSSADSQAEAELEETPAGELVDDPALFGSGQSSSDGRDAGIGKPSPHPLPSSPSPSHSGEPQHSGVAPGVDGFGDAYPEPIVRTRTYDLTICYDNFYRTPRMTLMGYDEAGFVCVVVMRVGTCRVFALSGCGSWGGRNSIHRLLSLLFCCA